MTGDWTTGRGFAPTDRSGPSLADIARWEAEALPAPTAKKPKRFRPRPDYGWYEGSKVFYDPGTFGKILDRVAVLREELKVWEDSQPRNSRERRRRARALARIHREIDSLPNRGYNPHNRRHGIA